MQSKQTYQPHIDGLRGIAIAAVVLYHFFPHTFFSGYTGVDVFFVISGYLISRLIWDGIDAKSFNLAIFYRQRALRIFPALTLIFIFCLIFGYFFTDVPDYASIGRSVFTGSVFIQNIALYNQFGYFDPRINTKPLMHLWSLGVEEQFYLLYPLIAAFLGRYTLPKWRVILLFVAFAFSFLFCIFEAYRDAVAGFYLLPSRLWELVAGAILAELAGSKRTLGDLWYCLPICGQARFQARSANWIISLVNSTASWLGLALLAVSSLLIPNWAIYPSGWAALPVAGAVLIIGSGTRTGPNQKLLSHSFMLFLGRISYPLYLWHWTLLSFAWITLGQTSVLFHLILLAATIFISGFTTIWVERPLRFSRYGTSVAGLLAASIASLAFLGYLVDDASGLPQRYSTPELGLADFHYDITPSTRINVCWLTTEPFEVAPEQCYDRLKSGDSAQSVLVWGDSHAAHLTAGIRKAYSPDVSVVQLDRVSCPPLVDFMKGDPICDRGNNFVMTIIKQFQPRAVILDGYWNRYTEDWSPSSIFGKALLQTIRDVKQAGVTDVIVVGPDPNWEDDLPRVAFRNMILDRINHKGALRVKNHLDDEAFKVDLQMKELLSDSGVTYVSSIDVFCQQQGCLVRTDESDISTLTTWDYGHLTVNGATYLARHIPLHLGSKDVNK